MVDRVRGILIVIGSDKSAYILVEGQTEEVLVRDMVTPHLAHFGWWVTPIIVKTNRPAGGPSYRGGATSWKQIEREIRLLLRDSRVDLVTTMFDYYGLPSECPGMADRPAGGADTRVRHVESSITTEIGDRRFLANLVLHESEAWVFAAAQQLGELFADDKLAAKLVRDVDNAGGPEEVNDDPNTAPSKRLRRYCPEFVKTQDGPLAVVELGLDRLRAQCPHLNEWLEKLERGG